MSLSLDCFVGQLALFPFNLIPAGWAPCEGQLLPIAQNTALFSLIGTNYGGDGATNFALPDLRGRVAIGQGQASGQKLYTIGQAGGMEAVQLDAGAAPSHSHPFNAFAEQATTNSPVNALPAEPVAGGRGGSSPVNMYAQSGQVVSLDSSLVNSVTGGGQLHNNMQPFMVLNWCIALQGTYPQRQ